MADEVRVVAVLRARKGMADDLLAVWPDLAGQVRAEDGCLAYDLHRVLGDDEGFVVLERWASLDALARHGTSAHMQEFGARSATLLAAPAEVLVLRDDPSA